MIYGDDDNQVIKSLVSLIKGLSINYLRFISFLITIHLSLSANAQLLVMDFNVDSTTTIVGPTPSSISASAGTLSGGSTGKGLSAKYQASDTKRDIDMDFTNTASIWDVDGIEVSIQYQREESTGWFFTRFSNDFRFGMSGGNLQVRYEVDNGAGGSTTVNSGNIQGITNDDNWRTYRFSYNPANGLGSVYIDGATVWTNDGPDNRDLYWTGAGNLRIGDGMDGAGAVEAIFDSVVVASFNGILLPAELSSFSVQVNESNHELSWVTQSETQNDYFEIQSSQDSRQWETIASIQGQGYSNSETKYNQLVDLPFFNNGYYRLKQVDYDGSNDYSEILFWKAPINNIVKAKVATLESHFEITLGNEKISKANVFSANGVLISSLENIGDKLVLPKHERFMIVRLIDSFGQVHTVKL